VLATDLRGPHPDILLFEGFRLDVARAGRVISKAELLAQVWPGVVVTDDSLSQCAGELRAALGERGPVLIRTLPKRGYLFDTVVTGEVAPPQTTPSAGNAGVSVSSQQPQPRAGLLAATVTAIALAFVLFIIGGSSLDSARPQRIDATLVAWRSMVVMPFVDMSSPKASYFADGVTQEIVDTLGRLPDALVIVGASSNRPDEATVSARNVGREYGVRHILTGSVQRDAERTAITVRMARTDTGALVWSERFEVVKGDAHWVHDIAERVAASLEIKLARSAFDPSLRVRSGEAMDLWMHGDHLMRHVKSHSELLEARRDFEAALVADPHSLHALSMLSMTHVSEVLYRWSPDRARSLALAKELAQRALSLDPDHTLALDALGNAYSFDSDFDAAYVVFKKALAVNPSSAKAQLNMASLLYFMARFEELKPYIANVMRLGRLDATIVGKAHSILAFSLMAQGKDEEAYREMRQAVIAAPSLPGARYGLISAAALTGRIDESHRLVAELLRDRPETTIALIRSARSSANSEFRKGHAHYFDGLRLSGLPEGNGAGQKVAATIDPNRK
jgi:TolB-like protein/Flp pilus assembly protein TadD